MAFTPRENNIVCVRVSLEGKKKKKKGKGRRRRRVLVVRCPRAPYVGGGELRKPWTTGGLGAARAPFLFRFSLALSAACPGGRSPARFNARCI